MDNVTHTLVGLIIGAACAGRGLVACAPPIGWEGAGRSQGLPAIETMMDSGGPADAGMDSGIDAGFEFIHIDYSQANREASEQDII